MGKHVEELMADRKAGDMPSPEEYRQAFEADAQAESFKPGWLPIALQRAADRARKMPKWLTR